MSILDSINSPDDIKKLSYAELDALSAEIRGFLIENVSKTGGHLASNLGVVELTLALHRVYDSKRDRILFDVGHQCYVHKIITGRKDSFRDLRTWGGPAGFPKPKESVHDAATMGHASNSVSLAVGMVRARRLSDRDYDIVSIIGDGALTGGLAYEGLCDAGGACESLVVILNDNGMSIDSNVGGISKLLSVMRVRPAYFKFKRRYRKLLGRVPAIYKFNHRIKEWLKRRLLPSNMFDDLGFYYLGPVDGHDIFQLEAVLRWAREIETAVLVHVKTQKGKGYAPAEQDPEIYHGVGPFDPERGIEKNESSGFSDVFGEALTQLAACDESIVALTAAMGTGTGLSEFSKRVPERFFDVGIAEGHAVAMAAGLANKTDGEVGIKPVFAVYSSFLQRGYDMLIHDVALSNLHVVFAVDRAGIVGQDGETHQGVFDVAYLGSVPNMTILCPSSYAELRDMLAFALYEVEGPVAVRFPRGLEGEYKESAAPEPVTVLREGGDLTLVSYGLMINNAIKAADILAKEGIEIELIKLNVINPLDCDIIIRSLEKTCRFISLEDVCTAGSAGTRILSACAKAGLSLKGAVTLDLGDGVLPHGTVLELHRLKRLDPEGISAAVREMFS